MNIDDLNKLAIELSILQEDDSANRIRDKYLAWGIEPSSVIETALEYAGSFESSFLTMRERSLAFMVGFQLGMAAAIEVETRRQSED